VKRAAILLAALLVARVDVALAGSTCGSSGGGGSSSSSSSSSDSDSSYSSSDSSSSTPVCRDTTDVVGYRECTRFGTWGSNLKIPALIVQLGTAVRSAPSLAPSDTGSFQHEDESFAYRTIAPPDAEIERQLVMTLRMGVGIGRSIYTAIDLEAGPIVSGPTATAISSSGTYGTPTVTQSRGFAFNAAAVVGVAHRIGNGRLGVEAAGGVRAASYTIESTYFHCETSTMVSGAAPLLEARTSYELWLSPFVSAGAMLGASVIDRGAWMGGINIGFHSRAFGGSR